MESGTEPEPGLEPPEEPPLFFRVKRIATITAAIIIGTTIADITSIFFLVLHLEF